MNLNRQIMIEKRKQLLNASSKNRKRLRKPPKWLLPISVEKEYFNYLKIYFNVIKSTVIESLFSVLTNLAQEANLFKPKMDSWIDNIDAIIKNITLKIDQNNPYNLESLTTLMGTKTAEWNSKEWQKTILQVFGVSTLQYEPWLMETIRSFSKENVALIKSIKDKSISDIETYTLRGIREGTRHEEIASQIKNQFNVTENKAELIARDQVSKLNGQLTKTRQQSLGVNEYIWMTSEDERVRGRPGGRYSNSLPSHWALENKICSWNDPTIIYQNGNWINRSSISAVEQHPGYPIQCRCWAKPIFDNFNKGN
jgi:SPP1 gp7 family putative phage head morphogenesis protein